MLIIFRYLLFISIFSTLLKNLLKIFNVISIDIDISLAGYFLIFHATLIFQISSYAFRVIFCMLFGLLNISTFLSSLLALIHCLAISH